MRRFSLEPNVTNVINFTKSSYWLCKGVRRILFRREQSKILVSSDILADFPTIFCSIFFLNFENSDLSWVCPYGLKIRISWLRIFLKQIESHQNPTDKNVRGGRAPFGVVQNYFSLFGFLAVGHIIYIWCTTKENLALYR